MITPANPVSETEHLDDTVRIGDSQYGRPFPTGHGLMVVVYEDDGDRYTTFGVLPEVVAAWDDRDRVQDQDRLA